VEGKRLIIGENWHVAWPGGTPIVEMNSDHWKLKVHEGLLSERGSPGSLSLFEAPRVEGRAARNAHMSFAKHMTSESWETRPTPGFRAPRTGWWKSGKPNHWFDAVYGAIVARSCKGISAMKAKPTATGAAPQYRPAMQPIAANTPAKPANARPEAYTRRSINFRRG
jgi:hypothetical protein